MGPRSGAASFSKRTPSFPSAAHLAAYAGFVVVVAPAQRMRQAAGGVRDHESVAGVGLALAGMQVGAPAHRQASR